MSNNQVIINFRTFIIDSWPSIWVVLGSLDWDESPYFLEYWMQANWELLVEQQTLEADQYLTPYGYGSSSEGRYTKQGVILTHRVTCRKKGKSQNQYYFLRFALRMDKGHKMEPPFDLIDVKDIQSGEILTLPLDEMYFSIDPIIQSES